jgi:1-acyl-sn-glycerol-3-phosphate acyltransferase
MGEGDDDDAGAGARLTLGERAGLAIGRALNERALGKRAQFVWSEHVGRRFVRAVLGHRVLVDNIDWLLPDPGRGVLLAINHRTWFDAYVTSFALYQAGAHRWAKRLFYPVRSTFFYEHPAGIAVNLALGGGTLYPPIFRDPAKAALTKDGVGRLIRHLQQPETLVGIHPEGTRNKGGDPYALLPAQPGAGQIALQAHPLVVPAFILGLGNAALEVVRKTFDPAAGRRDPVIIVFGDALDYEDLKGPKPRAALYKRMADRMRDAITALGARERALRAACAAGAISDDDPRWITNRARR